MHVLEEGPNARICQVSLVLTGLADLLESLADDVERGVAEQVVAAVVFDVESCCDTLDQVTDPVVSQPLRQQSYARLGEDGQIRTRY
jgi:hypothetical protein